MGFTYHKYFQEYLKTQGYKHQGKIARFLGLEFLLYQIGLKNIESIFTTHPIFKPSHLQPDDFLILDIFFTKDEVMAITGLDRPQWLKFTRHHYEQGKAKFINLLSKKPIQKLGITHAVSQTLKCLVAKLEQNQ